MLKIAPEVEYLSRSDWGARTDLPRLGTVLPSTTPTEAIVHHTVIIDQDATPNRWESVVEIIPKMRQLQTIRPDLGLDVPYNYVAFLMQYPHKIGLVLCEGRGPYRRGAHTKYHNVTGRALAIEGNTEIGLPIDPYVEYLSQSWGWIKDEHALVNLGNQRPKRGGLIFGHRDFRHEDDQTTWTVCPGQGAYDILPRLTFDRWTAAPIEPEPEPEEDEEVPQLVWTDGDAGRLLWVTDWKDRNWITNGAFARVMVDKEKWRDAGTLTSVELAAFNRLPKGEPIPA